MRPSAAMDRSSVILALLLAAAVPALAAPPVPSVSIQGIPPEVLIGETFHFQVVVSPDPTAIGYGPFLELYLERAGADCTGVPATPERCDGLHFVQAAVALASSSLPLTPCPAAAAAPFVFPVGPPCAPPNPAICPGTTPIAPTSCFFGAAPPACAGESTAGYQKVDLLLPFGSFVPGQPPIVVDVTVLVDSFADDGIQLRIKARGGFRFADDPLGKKPASLDPACPMAAAAATPKVLRLRKVYLGPESETATGPNFPRRYELTVDVADGQTVKDLVVTDCLSSGHFFLGATAPGATSTFDPVSRCLSVEYPSVTGGPGSSDASFTFDFYVPETDASGSEILGSSCKTPIPDQASAVADWFPQDPRNAPPPFEVSAQDDHVLIAKCLALQKSASVVQEHPGGAAGPTPGDVVEYRLDFQVSDFRTLSSLVIEDFLSDGLTLLPGAWLQVTDKNGVLGGPAAGVFTPGVDLFTSVFQDVYTCSDGTEMFQPTRIELRVSDLLAKLASGIGRHGQGIVTGGHAGLPLDGAATGRVTFLARIDDTFQRQTGVELKVDKHDPLPNCVVVSADVRPNANAPALPGPAIGEAGDDSMAPLVIVHDRLRKSVFAVNGVTNFTPPLVAPGDRVTFRVELPVPSTDAEDFVVDDFLPLPVFHVGSVFPLGPSCALPGTFPANTARLVGPLCTYLKSAGPSPTLTPQPLSNSLHLDLGTIQDPTNQQRKLDFFFTVQASADPFADGLHLTNHVGEQEKNTFGALFAQSEAAEIVLGQPRLRIRKGVVSTNRDAPPPPAKPPATAAVYTPSKPKIPGALFNPPGSLPAFTGTLTSSNIGIGINSDVSNLDACDFVRFAIAVENTGTSPKGAFDVRISDLLQSLASPCLVNPSNFQVTNGKGVQLSCNGGKNCSQLLESLKNLNFDVTLDDGPATGALAPFSPTSGNNLAIITFDARIPCKNAVPVCCSDTARIVRYAGAEGGPDHTQAGFSAPFPDIVKPFGAFVDGAKVCVTPRLVKSIVKTSEPHTPHPNDKQATLAIGEIVRFRLEVAVPEGKSPQMTLLDILPANLRWLKSTCAVVAKSAAIQTAPPVFNAGGAKLEVLFGNVTNTANNPGAEILAVECSALVRNRLGSSLVNFSGQLKKNSFTLTVKPPSGKVTFTSNTVEMVIAEPAGVLTKQQVVPPPSASTAVYLLTYKNAGTTTAFDVEISDTLPAPLVLAGSPVVTGPCKVDNTAPPGVVRVKCSELPSQGTVTVRIPVAGVPLCRSVHNEARLVYTSLPGLGTPKGPNNMTGASTPGGSGADLGERVYGNTASVDTFRCADLVLTKSHAAPFPLGQTGTYTFKVQNTGNTPSVPPDSVTDSLPSGLLFLSGGGNGWTCTSANGRDVTCTSSTPIPPGGSSSFTITVAVSCGLSPVQNCADLATTAEIDQADNRSCDPTAFTRAGPGCVAPPVSMTAWWPFDEPAGPTAADLAGSEQNNGTYQPALGPTPQPGKVAYSLCFDGVDDRVDVPDAADLDLDTGDFTIDTWIRTTAGQGIQTIVDKRDAAPAARGYAFFLFNGRVALQMATGAGSNNCSTSPASACTNYFGTTTPNIADGLWHHVAVTVDRNNPQGGVFYVDGQPFPATFDPTIRAQSLGNTAGARIGERAQSATGQARLQGCLDELEVFKRALSATEIKSIFDAGSAGKCKCTNCSTIDKVPAATLLLPYFEMDLDNPGGITTLFSIRNAAASPALTHVTIWSDQAVPVFAFNVYLPGLGSQGVNLRDILIDGNLPGPAPVPPIPSCPQLPYPPGAVSAALRSHLQRWLVGRSLTNQCAGQNYGDNIARGYVTVDTVNACTPSSLSPANWALYAPFLTNQNVLSGDYSYVNPGHNECHVADLVHIEACPTCFKPGDHTFYGRYNGASAADAREALPTTFEASFASGDSVTSLVVWRETNASASPYACGLNGPPSWYPLDAEQIVSFDSTGLSCQSKEPIPNAANLINVSSLSLLETTKVYLNLQHSKVAPIYGDSAAQAWVAVVKTFSLTCARDSDAIQLDCANAPITSVISTNQCPP